MGTARCDAHQTMVGGTRGDLHYPCFSYSGALPCWSHRVSTRLSLGELLKLARSFEHLQRVRSLLKRAPAQLQQKARIRKRKFTHTPPNVLVVLGRHVESTADTMAARPANDGTCGFAVASANKFQSD